MVIVGLQFIDSLTDVAGTIYTSKYRILIDVNGCKLCDMKFVMFFFYNAVNALLIKLRPVKTKTRLTCLFAGSIA